jgi:methylated-DNA-protein-cysteine methyltransferase related protein
MANYFEKVYEITRQIPYGRVCTYGIIADHLNLGAARMVGWALNNSNGLQRYHLDHDFVPAHRVVNRLGELSGRHKFGTPTLMQELLESEGIEVENDKIKDFEALLWRPEFF